MNAAVAQPEPIENLVRLAEHGDSQAAAALCRRFLPAVRSFARRRLRSKDAVDEFAQDVLLRLVEALRQGSIADHERVGGFVLGICKNLALDRARRRERRDALWEQHKSVLAEFVEVERDVPTLREMKLEDCLAQMSQRARDILRFSYVDAKSHLEIAATLSISEANARVLRHRTLGQLRDCMQKGLPWATR
ncbi:MAG TPA: sigma-70 family RNA polymerase sigma factor [Polyangiaceae bacterium]|nr:sigma-70 family RNA polymerase sigma factor [Polyangiaceae bacterium]